VTVDLFIPCLTDQLFPRSGMNMVRVLERLGISVRYNPAQTCCGQPAFNAGYRDDARRLARRFIDLFSDTEYVVAPSGSCVTMVKVFYLRLFDQGDGYRERATALAERVHEFTSFLVDVVVVADVGAAFRGKVALHHSCHGLRELGIQEQPRVLLEHVRGLTLVDLEMSDTCCGFGGTFAVKFPELSSAMAERKARAIESSGADVVTAIDSSCLMQMEGVLKKRGSRVRAHHIADILASEG